MREIKLTMKAVLFRIALIIAFVSLQAGFLAEAQSDPLHRLGGSDRDRYLNSFRVAAEDHARFQFCFSSKFLTRYCQESPNNRYYVSGLAVEEIERRIKARLDFLSATGVETAALVYLEASWDRSFSVYLFDRHGLVSAHSRRPFNARELADGLVSDLNVLTRAAPKRTRLLPAASTTRRTAAPVADLTQVSEYLLPGDIGAHIETYGYQRILVLPSGSTSSIPFAALKLPSGADFVDTSSFVVLPYIEALVSPQAYGLAEFSDVLTFDARQARRGPSFVVGDPDYAPLFDGSSFHALAGAEQEASIVAGVLQTDRILSKQDASYSAVKAELERIQWMGGIAYFATHGLASDENPMDESLLALSEQHLFAREIRDMDFGGNASMAVLSACQTGLGRRFDGGTFGLLRAFYHAGVDQIVGSLWNVDDQGTKALMTKFMQLFVEEELRPEEALRRAMISVRDDPDYGSDPAIWASFYVFGNPSR